MNGLSRYVHRAFRSRRGAASAGAVVMLSGALWLEPFSPSPRWPTAVAAQKAFTETLVETGTINASRLMLYAAPIGSGPSKILELVPEGTRVAPGDVLVRFDVSAVESALRKEEIGRDEAAAMLAQAHEALRLVGLEAAGVVDEAALEADAAERRALNEREGLGQLSFEEARAAEDEAGREEVRTKAAHADIAALLAEGFVTRAEVERAEQAHRRASETHRIAALKRDLLARFDRPAALARASAEVRSATRAVGQARERAAARIAQQRAAVAAAAAAAQAAEARVQGLRDRVAQAILRADSAGIVVYRELYFGGDRRKPQIGDEVWPNQPLVALPASDTFTVETEVREVDLYKIHAKQVVQVTVEAYPDLRLRAEVALVGAVARDDPSRVGTKRFPVTIKLLDGDDRLRIGMTTRVEVEVRALASVLVVPVDAVFEDQGSTYCVVRRSGAPLRTFVRIGGRNAHEAAVLSGLTPNALVYRVDPTVSRESPEP